MKNFFFLVDRQEQPRWLNPDYITKVVIDESTIKIDNYLPHNIVRTKSKRYRLTDEIPEEYPVESRLLVFEQRNLTTFGTCGINNIDLLTNNVLKTDTTTINSNEITIRAVCKDWFHFDNTYINPKYIAGLTNATKQDGTIHITMQWLEVIEIPIASVKIKPR
jgi:hypothetical protein